MAAESMLVPYCSYKEKGLRQYSRNPFSLLVEMNGIEPSTYALRRRFAGKSGISQDTSVNKIMYYL
jgi:hypothetical protein